MFHTKSRKIVVDICDSKINKGEKMSRLQRIKFWFRQKAVPWIRKNKIPLIVIFLSIFFIVFFIWKNGRSPTENTQGKQIVYEKPEGGISGKDVKKKLLEWKEDDNYAIVVASADNIVNHSDLFSSNKYSVLFMDDDQTQSLKVNNSGTMLWGINYGNVLKDDVIIKTGDSSFYTVHGLMKKTKKQKYRDVETGKVKKKVDRAKTNLYSEKTGIKISDEEYFLEYTITDGNEKVIGCAYVPEKITVEER